MDNTTYDNLIDMTGILDGDCPTTAREVRGYLTIANMREMFGACDLTQNELSALAEEIIRRENMY